MMLVKMSDGFYVYDDEGKKKLGGPYRTRAEAERRLRQIEAHKDRGERGEKSRKDKD